MVLVHFSDTSLNVRLLVLFPSMYPNLRLTFVLQL